MDQHLSITLLSFFKALTVRLFEGLPFLLPQTSGDERTEQQKLH